MVEVSKGGSVLANNVSSYHGIAVRMLVLVLLAWTTMAAGCGTSGEHQAGSGSGHADAGGQKVVRIGYQKYGSLNILKSRGTLEQQLSSVGYSVQWILFPGGPQLLEAMNAGSIDIGSTGEAPPIFAQAAGTPLVYLANEPASPRAEAILVPKDSPIRRVADLKGKKVVLNKGSNVHYLLVKALEKAGLKVTDIQPVYLPPEDARAAFERGSVDAWVIWDPFYAAAQTATGARVIANGTDLVANREFYLANRSFAQSHVDLVALLLKELQKADDWAANDPHGAAQFLSPELGIDVPSLELAASRRSYGVQQITDQVLNDQQRIADVFFQLGLIPKPIQVKEAVLSATH